MKDYKRPPYELLKDYTDTDNSFDYASKETMMFGVPWQAYPQVGLKTVMQGESFNNSKDGSLVFALGHRENSIPVCPNLANIPNILLAGSSGSGTTTCIWSILTSLIYKYSPEDLRILLVDSQRCDLSIYEAIPHMLTEHVIKEEQDAIAGLDWAVKEMDRRYEIFFNRTVSGTPTVNLSNYNSNLREGEEKLPHLVVVIESYAEIEENYKKDFNLRLLKLVQKSGNAGIHIIIATKWLPLNRDSMRILNYVGTKMVFQMRHEKDSESFLGSDLAVYLRGYGDMFYSTPEIPLPLRVRGCMTTRDEVQKVVEYIAQNNSYSMLCIDEYINNFEVNQGIPKEILKILEEEQDDDES